MSGTARGVAMETFTVVPLGTREPAAGSVMRTMPSTSSDFTCDVSTANPLLSRSQIASAWASPVTSGTVFPPHSSSEYVMPIAAAAMIATTTTATIARVLRAALRFFASFSASGDSYFFWAGAGSPSILGSSIVSPERHERAGGT